MIFVNPNVMCVSIPEPKSWKLDNGREGVTYRVDLSDGTSTASIACKDINVYQVFRPFQRYQVGIELLQTNFDGRLGVKAQVISAERAKDKE